MKKIILYNPSITTLNIGDEIIFDSVKSQIDYIIKNNFIVNVSSHLPVSSYFAQILSDSDLKFVCGTNLLRNMLELRFRQWDINIFNASKLGPAVLIGVGWQKDKKPFTPYTKMVYKKILSRNYIHSVRDEYTKNMLNKMGFDNVINTGCPTMWDFDKKKCKRIPHQKAENVIYTLTDYKPNKQQDTLMLDILKQYYKKVYLWIQGYNDLKYAQEIGIDSKVTIIAPSLEEYDLILDTVDSIEYIGTRLHGGIRALQHNKRAMILAVDNRALEMNKNFNLPVFERDKLTADIVESLILQERTTEINIPEENIAKWKAQFLK